MSEQPNKRASRKRHETVMYVLAALRAYEDAEEWGDEHDFRQGRAKAVVEALEIRHRVIHDPAEKAKATRAARAIYA